MRFTRCWIDSVQRLRWGRLRTALLRPHILFCVLGLISSLSYTFITPPFRAVDEFAHYLRAYEISRGAWHGNVEAPQGFVAFWHTAKRKVGQVDAGNADSKYDAGDWEELYAFTMSGPPAIMPAKAQISSGNPVPYLPAALIMAIAEPLGARPLTLVYLARLATLFAGLALVTAAIRRMPRHPWAMALFSLLPMAAYLRGMISADPVTYGLACLFAAQVGAKALTEDLGRKPLIITAFLLAQAKSAYAPLLLTALIIPVRRLGTGWRGYALLAAIILPGLLASAAWVQTARALHYATENAISATQPTSSEAQVEYVLTHPLAYAKVLYNTLGERAFTSTTFRQFTGILGWLDRPLSPGMYGMIALALLWILIAAPTPNQPQVGLRASAWVAVITFGTFMLTLLFLYVQWNPPRNPFITGFQGRYLYPLVPFGLLIAPHYPSRLPPWGWAVALTLLALAFTLSGAWVILEGDYAFGWG